MMNINAFDNPKKLTVDINTDSGYLSGEQQLSGLLDDEKVVTDSMTRKTTGNSADSENITDSGIVSCSNLSSLTTEEAKELPPYVPDFMTKHASSRKPQHPTLNIEKYFEQDEDGYTYLHIALLHNVEPAINALINYAEPTYLNIRNFAGQTCLHLAVLLGMDSVVRKLIDAGADVNIRDNRCNTALHLAVLNNDFKCAQIITSAIHPPSYGNEQNLIANLEQWNFDGETCFFLACKLKNIPIMRILANSGANVNTREGRSGYSPLHLAIERNAKEVFSFLCEDCQSIVNLDNENYSGLTAFQLSLLTNQQLLADYLVRKGATTYYTPDSDYEEEFESDDEESICEFEKSQLVNKIAEIAVN